MGIPTGEATLSFSLLPPNKLGSSHKGKNLLTLEQMHSFKSNPILERLEPPGKQTGSH